MEEVKAFIKKADKYFHSAEVLIQAGDYDSAVSRTYYAMFHLATALLKTKGITVSTHKGIQSQFAEQFIKTKIFPQKMAQSFRMAFDDRQAGDYEVLEMLEKEDAEKLLERGKQFFQKAQEYLKLEGYEA